MAWTERRFTKGEIDRAGDLFRIEQPLEDGLVRAYEVLDNWRSAHSFPLNAMQIWLRRNARSVSKTALIAQRLKRVVSIVLKLRRFRDMKLSRMHDLGGCRAVMTNVDEVRRVEAQFKKSESRHELARCDDYISAPKDDGYRSIHLVYKYKSQQTPAYDDQRIEIQLRSKLQHAWATAVETADTFNRENLKGGQGSEDWKQFFRLVSASFAALEGTPTVANTPGDPKALRAEIGALDYSLGASRVLNAFRVMDYYKEKHGQDGDRFYLLVLDSETNRIEVKRYRKDEQKKATADYLTEERRIRDNPKGQAVLVSVDSLRSLKRAYPNYFGDTTFFLQQFKRVMNY